MKLVARAGVPVDGTKDLLVRTRALLADLDHWTKSSWALDKEGRDRSPTDPEAVCWCLAGALKKECPEGGMRDYRGAHEALSRIIIEQCWAGWTETEALSRVFDYNDASATTHADVLDLLDRAIATC